MKKTRLRAAPALVGVIASVTALGAGPALGASLSKCTTITKPGSYVLTRNLTAVGNCFVVGADFVTIDLGGWAITGDGTGGGITDQGAGRRGIAVRNGAITGFEVGISVGAKSIVSGINVDGHGCRHLRRPREHGQRQRRRKRRLRASRPAPAVSSATTRRRKRIWPQWWPSKHCERQHRRRHR